MPTPVFQVRVLFSEPLSLGPGKVRLLEAIRDAGSISGAARLLHISYRRAWLMADTLNKVFPSPLIDTAAGGVKGGGARLTGLGEEVLQRFAGWKPKRSRRSRTKRRPYWPWPVNAFKIKEYAMKKLISLCTGLLGLMLAQAAIAGGDFAFIMSKKANFDDVRENLVMAIENRGVKIDHQSFIADMLARTGRDIGLTKAVYLRGDQIQFCKADLSRAMMEADPRNMAFCPFIFSLYVTPDKPGVVNLAYRKMSNLVRDKASKKALADIEKMMGEIAREAMQ